MQQRRVRLGDILDDYCPRERRITNHAVVAMIDDQVKQTRCTTCQSDHEYKAAKAPPPRRKKSGALSGEDAVGTIRPRSEPAADAPVGDESIDAFPDIEADVESETVTDDAAPEPDAEGEAQPVFADGAPDAEDGEDRGPDEGGEQDEWPVHRPLIRAQLPRPEGQTPERKQVDFTMRPGGVGARFDANRNGKRHRGHRPMRHAQGQGQGQGQPGQQGPRHGAGQRPRQGGGPGGPQGPRHGNRPGQGGGRPGQGPGQGRGPRQGSGGGGRKRGR